jgi:hypothetical protein
MSSVTSCRTPEPSDPTIVGEWTRSSRPVTVMFLSFAGAIGTGRFDQTRWVIVGSGDLAGLHEAAHLSLNGMTTRGCAAAIRRPGRGGQSRPAGSPDPVEGHGRAGRRGVPGSTWDGRAGRVRWAGSPISARVPGNWRRSPLG